VKTTRQRIRIWLTQSIDGKQPSELARRVEMETENKSVSVDTILSHIDHLKQSLQNEEETISVKPPECTNCTFNQFDEFLNCPTKCPECHSENIQEPVFKID
jgi:predicted Zn-ribbon and HTH transcriptional regulator